MQQPIKVGPVKRQTKGTAGAELLFQILTEREEKHSVAIASNESFRGWTRPAPTHASAPPSSTD